MVRCQLFYSVSYLSEVAPLPVLQCFYLYEGALSPVLQCFHLCEGAQSPIF